MQHRFWPSFSQANNRRRHRKPVQLAKQKLRAELGLSRNHLRRRTMRQRAKDTLSIRRRMTNNRVGCLKPGQLAKENPPAELSLSKNCLRRTMRQRAKHTLPIRWRIKNNWRRKLMQSAKQ